MSNEQNTNIIETLQERISDLELEIDEKQSEIVELTAENTALQFEIDELNRRD